MRLIPLFMAVLASLFLPGCGHTPMTITVFDALGIGQSSVDEIKINPKLQYMRVSTPARVVLMVLGYADPTLNGVLETWYSSEGEVLKLLNGRLVSSSGLDLDWRSVRYSGVPDWNTMIGKTEAQYQRVRDEMPGYKFGIQENLRLLKVNWPSNSRLHGIPANALVWFEESLVLTNIPHAQLGSSALPTARYAIGYKNSNQTVMYAEQCLATDQCISWQPWPGTL